MIKAPRPPAHLSKTARNWWQNVVKAYELEEHHLKLLQLAAEAWDRAQAARQTLATDGVTFTDDRGNPRAHPAVGIERDARTAFARLVRELDLDTEAPPANSRRPPPLASNRRGA